MKWQLTKRKEQKAIVQADHMIVGVTGNMEPSTGINQSWVPALQHVVGVRKPASQSMQSVPYKQNKTKPTSIMQSCLVKTYLD